MPDPVNPSSPVPPSSAPRPARSGSGCLILVIGVPIVIVLGLLAGKALGGGDDDTTDELHVILDEGTDGGTDWRVDAVLDVEGDSCAFLFADGEQLTGACDPTPQDATFGDRTVVFGKALGERTEQVEVTLSDGDTVAIDTVEASGIDGRFYVQVVDGDVDAEGYAEP